MLKPEPLVSGSHMTLQRVYYAILMRWRGKNDLERHIKDWDDFLDIAPTSDDVDEYLKDHPDKFYVPFRKPYLEVNILPNRNLFIILPQYP